MRQAFASDAGHARQRTVAVTSPGRSFACKFKVNLQRNTRVTYFEKEPHCSILPLEKETKIHWRRCLATIAAESPGVAGVLGCHSLRRW
jgi:hypothetical protein